MANFSQVDNYLNKGSATLLTITKMIEGIMTGYSLFLLWRTLSPIIKEVMQGSIDFIEILKQLGSELGLTDSIFNGWLDVTTVGMVFSSIMYFGLFIAIVVEMLMIVIESISLLILRVTRSGAAVVKTLHQFYLAFDIVHLLWMGYATFLYFQNNQQNSTGKSLIIALVIIGIVYLIVMLLHICYHKDIAMAMSTVSYEIREGKTGDLKKTHLSGISFLFGTPYMFILVMVVVDMFKAQPSLREMSRGQLAITITILAVFVIKHLSICFCNRNLKAAR
ncbi:MAG: hypothetical protein IJX90_03985 [Blautia sp.]|nr:hypothetical protein [Blautia sp.]